MDFRICSVGMQAEVLHKPAKVGAVQTKLVTRKIVELNRLILTMKRSGSGAASHPIGQCQKDKVEEREERDRRGERGRAMVT
jgi:hypothetical protein